jgi:hypothetical protein
MSTRLLPGRVALTESDLMRAVTDLARLLGWTWVHHRPAQTEHGWRTPVSGPMGKGWPDLVLVRVRDHRILFVELKAQGGVLADDQRQVLETLAEAGQDVYVWKPENLDNGSIVEALR